MRFAPAWMATEATSVAAKSQTETGPEAKATAVPTMTGVVDAVKENGRTARHHTCHHWIAGSTSDVERSPALRVGVGVLTPAREAPSVRANPVLRSPASPAGRSSGARQTSHQWQKFDTRAR